MSRSVQRRIVRNIREHETGRRNPIGCGRVRGADPFQRALEHENDRRRFQAMEDQRRLRGK